MKSLISVFVLLVAPLVAQAASSIDKFEAVARAEQFIAANGYTALEAGKLKKDLNFESIEFRSRRDDVVKGRFNTLKPKAIGIRAGSKGSSEGWSVAFDYAETAGADVCRVVTMGSDGSNMRVQHVDGIRSKFVGFDDK